jgi:hypothetical protein
MKIPKKFYHGDNQPVAETVGQLKKLLAELPDHLPIKAGFSNEAQVVVYNHKQSDVHVSIQEPL